MNIHNRAGQPKAHLAGAAMPKPIRAVVARIVAMDGASPTVRDHMADPPTSTPAYLGMELLTNQELRAMYVAGSLIIRLQSGQEIAVASSTFVHFLPPEAPCIGSRP